MSIEILRKPPRFRVPRYAVLAAGILTLIGGSIILSLHRSQPQVNHAAATIKLSRGTVQQTYSATGQLVPVTVKTFTAPAGATVNTVAVHTGEKVSAHQLLFTMTSPSLMQSLAKAQQTLQSDENALAVLTSSLTTQQANLEISNAQASVDAASRQLASDQAKGQIASPTAGVFTTQAVPGETLNAGSTIGTVGSRTITAPQAGTITAIHATSGSTVSSGTVLVTITNPRLSATLNSDQLTLVNDQLKLLTAQQKYSSGALATQVTQARATVASDKASLTSVENQVRALSVRAPFAGVVTRIGVQSGQSVSSHSTLLTLDSRQLYMSFPVSQTQMSTLAVGQTATVNTSTVSALGKITHIGYAGTYSGGLSTFPVTVSVPAIGGLRPGMAVQASIAVKKVSHAFVVPLEALHQKGHRTTLWVQQGTTHKSVRVTVLLTNSLDAAVKSPNLKTGMPIIIATATSNGTTKLHVKGKPAHPGHGHGHAHGKP